jgi:hypothetical protein
MKSFTSIIFLILFLAALLVPAVVFYNKWTKQNADEAALQVSDQRVSTAAVFAGFQDKPSTAADDAPQPGKMWQPDAAAEKENNPAVSSGKARAGGSAVTKASGAKDGPAGARAAANPLNGSGLPPAAEPSITAAVPLQSTGPVTARAQAPASAGNAEVSYFNPKTTRDPTVSPEEYDAIAEEEERTREAERQRLMESRRKTKESTGENRIKLQGVVGVNAIINNDMCSVGDTVNGVKVIKIGENYVIGEYKGKKFRKVLQ